MIALLRTWLTGITAAAMLVALAESLAPAGAVRKIGRLTGSLVLLLAILQPVVQLDGRELAQLLEDYNGSTDHYSAQLEVENQNLVKAIIQEETGAYIQDKAASLGVMGQVTVEVTVEVTLEGTQCIPAAVTVRGTLTGAQRLALTGEIATNLAIPAERQRYVEEDVT